MKTLIIFTLLSLIFYTEQNAKGKAWLNYKQKQQTKAGKYCRFEIIFPVLSVKKKDKDKIKILRIVNKLLRNSLLSSIKSYVPLCEQAKKEKQENGFIGKLHFNVVYINSKVLSVFYSGYDYFSGTPYPNKIFKSYNFDLKTGLTIPYNSLFKQDVDYKKVMHHIIANDMLRQKVVQSPKDFVHEQLDYDYYFLEKELIIFNIFDMHVLQSVQTKVKYNSIKDILAPDFYSKFMDE
ncbi:MAG: hypothetical protein H7A25_02930 [Leptospiraceae bacterium]|nr:hypothetical protein [Leptospiraceae bacterium]MCP5498833.1 hypothetical protein [Leptospiraceae bacterium]